jgi:hypothetical protein
MQVVNIDVHLFSPNKNPAIFQAGFLLFDNNLT